MTRENKLALVMGFALILFVGILVSDHFSIARTQQAADLLPMSDPLVDARLNDPDLFSPSGAQLASHHDPAPLVQDRSRPQDPVAAATWTHHPAEAAAPVPPADDDDQVESGQSGKLHEVRSGESLTTICQRYYGSGDLVGALARHNKLEDPDRLLVGRRLRIPDAAALAGPASARTATSSGGAAAAPENGRTYTVKAGDALSSLAQHLLGSSRRWRELYEANRQLLNDPDDLRVGMILKIPD